MSFKTTGAVQHRNWNLFLGRANVAPPSGDVLFLSSASFDYFTSSDDYATLASFTSAGIPEVFAGLSASTVFQFGNGLGSYVDSGAGFVISALPGEQKAFAVKSPTYCVALNYHESGATEASYLSTDGGLTWSNVGASIQCGGFTYSSTADQFLISLLGDTFATIYKTANGYSGLTAVYTAAPGVFETICAWGDLVLAGFNNSVQTDTFKFARSVDGGNTFATIDTGILPAALHRSREISTMAFDETSIVVCGYTEFNDGGGNNLMYLLVSLDAGLTWSRQDVFGYTAAQRPRTLYRNGAFYAVGLDPNADICEVFRSTDGIVWTLQTSLSGLEIFEPRLSSSVLRIGSCRDAP